MRLPCAILLFFWALTARAQDGPGELDLTYCFLMGCIRDGVLDPGQVNYINALVDTTTRESR